MRRFTLLRPYSYASELITSNEEASNSSICTFAPQPQRRLSQRSSGHNRECVEQVTDPCYVRRTDGTTVLDEVPNALENDVAHTEETMKAGVNLINFGPGATADSMRRLVEISETLGYHLIMTSDHIAVTADVNARYPAPFYEPLSTLGWLAGITEKIEIGTTVIILPYRSPLEIAKTCANIDQLSGGRFILGVGVGWAQGEFKVLNSPFNQRGAITDEYLNAIKLLWTQDVASFDGKYVSFEDVYTAPRPVQDPHPPIWVGGASDAALRRTVKLGNAWHPIRIRVDSFKSTGIPRLQEIAEQEEKAVPDLCPRIRLRITDAPMDEDQRLAGEGTIDQIRGDLEELQDLGCTYVLLDTYYEDVEATRHHETSWRMLATIAEEALDLGKESVR